MKFCYSTVLKINAYFFKPALPLTDKITVNLIQILFKNVAFETNQLATVVQMIATELGVSAIPSLYKQQMQSLNVEFRELTAPTISRGVGIITRRRYPSSKTAQAFITILRNYYLPRS
jgi:LysR family carnitine catabolism transcriptional activator